MIGRERKKEKERETSAKKNSRANLLSGFDGSDADFLSPVSMARQNRDQERAPLADEELEKQTEKKERRGRTKKKNGPLAAIVVTRRRAGAATTCRAGAEVDAMPTRIAPPRAAEVGRAASEGASMVCCVCVCVSEGRRREKTLEPSTRKERNECCKLDEEGGK